MTSPLQQKIKITGPVVVTANRVGDGAVVYRRADGGWTTDLDNAAVTTDAGGPASLWTARPPTVFAPSTLMSLRSSSARDGEVRPGNLRERIRRSGPTIDLPVTLRVQSAVAST